MCDCAGQDEKDAVEAVTLFEKCPGSVNDRGNLMENWKTAKIDDSDTDRFLCYDEIKKTESSVCSSDSTRTYKFINSWESRNFVNDEQEEPVYQPVPCGPCLSESDEEFEEEQEPDIEYTLAIIKPEAVECRKEIENRILEEGFQILQTRWLLLAPEQASEFYSDNYGETYFPHLVAYMASGSIIVFVLAKQQAIQDWRMLMGPTKVTEARFYFPDSIRAKFGRRGEDFKNAVHGSANREMAEREIHFFFPDFVTEPLMRGEVAVDYLLEVVNKVLMEGLTTCCQTKPPDPILWLAHWLILNNPNKPKLPEHLAIPRM
ncbi:nucleoside diphosphate kinase homolog 5 [Cephus cinctus]|uniref:Nucleoside diphosphate kinase homolog 5 n=1 Tax=Cephus cinctus TaxID=211228 RepID=A0AAJ7BR78_CEPCN|nr:nucleoside diphosphate kinase homolog 5 [Cephus cinctus]